jgi:hypothetical protein
MAMVIRAPAPLEFLALPTNVSAFLPPPGSQAESTQTSRIELLGLKDALPLFNAQPTP